MPNSQLTNRSLVFLILMSPFFAEAEILLNKPSEVKLYGDVRYRYEQDERTDDLQTERTRSLIRARIGTSFKPSPAWAGSLRLSTDATSANNRDTSQSTTDNDKNGEFGLDQAYVAYTPSPIFNMIFGKSDLVFFQQNDVFWDRDISPEGASMIARMGGLSFSASRITLIEGDWQPDVTADTLQLVYKSGGLSFAYGQAKINDHKQFGRDTDNDGSNDVYGFQSDEYSMISAEEKRGSWIFGIEYIVSNSGSADTARIWSYQQRMGPAYGFRIYKYMVEANSVMGDGMFSQDDFPTEGTGGVSNFKGYKFQLDFYTSKTSSVDLSFYEMDRIHHPDSFGPTASDAIMTRRKMTRMQMNFNLSF